MEASVPSPSLTGHLLWGFLGCWVLPTNAQASVLVIRENLFSGIGDNKRKGAWDRAGKAEGVVAHLRETLQVRQAKSTRSHRAQQTGCVTSEKSFALAEPPPLPCKQGFRL